MRALILRMTLVPSPAEKYPKVGKHDGMFPCTKYPDIFHLIRSSRWCELHLEDTHDAEKVHSRIYWESPARSWAQVQGIGVKSSTIENSRSFQRLH